jgi:hypothetical protein
MCLRIRQEQAELKVSGTTLTPPSLDRLRPRLAGAAAVALIAGLAAAAMVMPSSVQQPPPPQQNAAPAQPLTPATTPSAGAQERSSPSGIVIEQTSTSMDDGVPTTSTDLSKTAVGGCNHEL